MRLLLAVSCLLPLLCLLPVALSKADVEKTVSETDVALTEAEGEEEAGIEAEPVPHPCQAVSCEPGQECVLDDSDSPICQCISDCGDSDEYQVCSTTNKTFSSLCELLRQKCLCGTGSKLCKDLTHSEIDVDYYSACQELPACPEDEAVQFPHRVRSWFFLIMKELAKHEGLSADYLKWMTEAELQPKHWLLPAVWKYCDLDNQPGDNHVSTAELHELIASLKMYEACLLPFLSGCDSDGDKLITMHEWGVCLGMSEGESRKFENYCDEIRNSA